MGRGERIRLEFLAAAMRLANGWNGT